MEVNKGEIKETEVREVARVRSFVGHCKVFSIYFELGIHWGGLNQRCYMI